MSEFEQNETPTEFTMDEFFSMEVDQSQVEETLRKGLVPSGTYQTDPAEFGEMNVYPRLVEEKDDQGTVTGHRRVVRITGRGRAKVKIGEEMKLIEGRIEFEMSPEYRNKRDWNTGEISEQPDSRSKLWAQACKAFEATYHEKAKNGAQVVSYLTSTPVRFRIGQVGIATKANPNPDGEPKNLVFNITAIRG